MSKCLHLIAQGDKPNGKLKMLLNNVKGNLKQALRIEFNTCQTVIVTDLQSLSRIAKMCNLIVHLKNKHDNKSHALY